MMDFKAMVNADNAVFINTGEFAEKHTIKYDGEIYENVPIVIEDLKETDRPISNGDNMRGIYLASTKAYVTETDLNGVIPEKGKYFEIDDGTALGKPFFTRYRVEKVSREMGMLCLELEALDE